MTAALGLLPSWIWRWLAILSVALAVGVFGYVKGLKHEEKVYDAFKQSVAIEGQKQNLHTQTVIQQQAEITKGVVNGLSDQINSIDAYYDARIAAAKRLPDGTGSVKVSAVSSPTCTANSPVRDALSPTAASYNQLAEQCAKTTAIAVQWQNWAKQNGMIK